MLVYSERLTAPLSYWVIGFVVGVSTVTAVGFYLGPLVAVFAGLVATAGVTALVGWFGSTEVRVDAAGVRVGPALLEWPYVGEVTVLDAAATRERLGVRADTRAFVVQRTGLSESVVVEVVDAADPHPYWPCSSRSPARCAAAIAQARAENAEA